MWIGRQLVYLELAREKILGIMTAFCSAILLYFLSPLSDPICISRMSSLNYQQVLSSFIKLLKIWIPRLEPIGTIYRLLNSFGITQSASNPSSTCSMLWATTGVYWYIETTLFVSFEGVRHTSPIQNTFPSVKEFLPSFWPGTDAIGWTLVTLPSLSTRI